MKLRLFRLLFPRVAVDNPVDNLDIALVLGYLGSEHVNLVGKATIIFIAGLDGGQHVGNAFFESVLQLQLAFLALCNLSFQP